MNMNMEGEINNSILVWTTIVACLCYCHFASKIFSSSSRSLSILPIACVFLLLPLRLTSIHIGGVTSFFIAWLASFKLILFAFQKGPLYSNPPLPLPLFILLACFPIKIQHNPPKKIQKSSRVKFAAKITIVALLIQAYNHKEHIHTKIIWSFYCIHIYIMLEIFLSLFGSLARSLVRAEIEPAFDEPYLATSLQDFWGRRWNLMVTNVMYPTVFQPVRGVSARLVGRKWAAIPGVLATFLVSGLMHELIVFNIGRVKPSGEMIGFFVLHGVSLSVEIVIKKMLAGKYSLPGIVSGPLTLVYVMWTSFGLFFPPLLRAKADLKGCTESLAFLEFLRARRLVSPNQMSCPFL